ncbi:MAG: glycerophosphodiester phosphodiesterase family protein, partial [Halobacteria archaeon]|nr:glycerophosphodiester phosphodiesterase family protein [Halobacteria archaeon]
MVKIVGHRGAAGLSPENTLPSFKTAVALGVDAVECDVRESSDGHPVVIHDETVDRTTNGSGSVSEHTLSELKELNADGESIPTLGEVLDVLVGSEVNVRIELKEEGLSHRV